MRTEARTEEQAEAEHLRAVRASMPSGVQSELRLAVREIPDERFDELLAYLREELRKVRSG